MPPGMLAKAEPVVATRRAAERASVRKVRDISERLPGADCAPKRVTKVQRSGIAELL